MLTLPPEARAGAERALRQVLTARYPKYAWTVNLPDGRGEAPLKEQRPPTSSTARKPEEL